MSWNDEVKVQEYVGRIGRVAARGVGEGELVEALPERVGRVLDLGCGDGRIAGLVLGARPEVTEAILLDRSEPMLARARERFAGDDRVQVVRHDLADPLPDLEPVDAVVSGFAIHHLTDQRKQALLAEAAALLNPGGVLANLEVVRCATPELQAEFERRIDRPGGDPEDLLAEVEPQLAWMRAVGLAHVDCQWRWRGFALLVGRAPTP